MIIYDQPMSDYLASLAIGSSSAKLVLESLRLFKDERDGLIKSGETDATAFGTAFHAFILQPDLFQSLLSEGPINEKTCKPYGRDSLKWKEWEAVNPGRIVLPPDEMETLLLMQERMPREVREIFANPTAKRECSIYQDFNGLAVKCRPDQLDSEYINDLKTIDDINNIRRAFRQRKYWFGQAWYKRIVAKECGERKHRFIFAEKKAPYRWKIVGENEDRVYQSMIYVDDVIQRLQDAATSGQWIDVDYKLYQELSWEDCGVYDENEIAQTSDGINL